MPTALSSVPRYADIARRLVLASRLPSRAAPALHPDRARCSAGAKFPATSCLGAFRPPAFAVRGETVIPAAENLHRMRTLVFESCTAGLKPFVDPSNLSVLR
jgi:hypothetical protein